MVGEHPVKKDLVSVVHGSEEHVFGQIAGLGPVLGIGSGGLVFQGQDSRWKEANKAEFFSFDKAEGGALVEAGIGEDLLSSEAGAPGSILV
jgi:hypothetical protein